MFPGAVTLTVKQTTVDKDDLGNGTTEETEVEWPGCMVAPRYANESTDPRVAPVVVGKTVYGPSIAIDSDDTVVIDGADWQVDGSPAVWPWPGGGTAGLEVQLKRASGV